MFESGKRITMQIHTGKQLQWKKAGIQVWVEPVVDAIYRERVYARATAARVKNYGKTRGNQKHVPNCRCQLRGSIICRECTDDV